MLSILPDGLLSGVQVKKHMSCKADLLMLWAKINYLQRPPKSKVSPFFLFPQNEELPSKGHCFCWGLQTLCCWKRYQSSIGHPYIPFSCVAHQHTDTLLCDRGRWVPDFVPFAGQQILCDKELSFPLHTISTHAAEYLPECSMHPNASLSLFFILISASYWSY